MTSRRFPRSRTALEERFCGHSELALRPVVERAQRERIVESRRAERDPEVSTPEISAQIAMRRSCSPGSWGLRVRLRALLAPNIAKLPELLRKSQ
jgi:hypothetical protein